MATSITLTTNTASITECTLTKNAASTEYTLASGWRGPAGATGPAGDGASDFADLGGVPADNTALADSLALKAPLASPTFTGPVTATGAVTAGARVTASRGTVGVGTVYTDGSLTDIAGTSTDFLSRFVVGDSITFNTTGGSETKQITAIHSDTSMTTLPFSWPSASGAEAYTHTTASAVMNPSGAITGTRGTFSGPVSMSGLTITGIPLPIASGGTGASSAGAARTNLGAGAVGSAIFAASTVAAANSALKTIKIAIADDTRVLADYADDSELSVSLSVGSWVVDLKMLWGSSGGAINAYRLIFTGAISTTVPIGQILSRVAVNGQPAFNAGYTESVNNSCHGALLLLHVTTAGTFKIDHRCNNATGTSIRRAGSTIIATKIA